MVEASREAVAAVIRRNNVTICGRDDGQVVMLAHGFGCDQAMWRKLLPYFVDNYRLVLLDHVGAGHSDTSSNQPATEKSTSPSPDSANTFATS